MNIALSYFANSRVNAISVLDGYDIPSLFLPRYDTQFSEHFSTSTFS
jgi:hypothetical protein